MCFHGHLNVLVAKSSVEELSLPEDGSGSIGQLDIWSKLVKVAVFPVEEEKLVLDGHYQTDGALQFACQSTDTGNVQRKVGGSLCFAQRRQVGKGYFVEVVHGNDAVRKGYENAMLGNGFNLKDGFL